MECGRMEDPDNPPQPPSWNKILKTVCKTGDLNDFTFIVRDGCGKESQIPIASTWLKLSSNGLANLLDNLPSGVNQCVLPLVKPRTLKNALNFIFKRKLKNHIGDDDIVELLSFNSQYVTVGLLDYCTDLLKERLTLENAVKIKRIAGIFDISSLKETALTLIVQNAAKVLSPDCNEFNFLDLSETEVCELLRCDQFNRNEINAFNAVLRWARNVFSNLESSSISQSNGVQLRAILKQIVPLIRFQLMTPSELFQFVKPTEILTTEEMLLVYDVILGNSPLDALTALNFNPNQSNVQDAQQQQQFENNTTSHQHSINQSAICITDMEDNEDMDMGIIENEIASNNSRPSTPFSPLPPKSPSFRVVVETPVVDSSLNALLHRQLIYERSNEITNRDMENNHSPPNLFLYKKTDATYNTFEEFLYRLSQNPSSDLNSTCSVQMQNVKIMNNYSYPSVPMKSIGSIDLDLNMPNDKDFLRMDRSFDIRRYLFYRHSGENQHDVKLEELWNKKIPINIVVNGVTLLKIAPDNNKELRIAFRNGANNILSGLGKSEKLHKLSLLKTDVPHFEQFPCKYLTNVLFYHCWALSENYASDFIKRCTSLETLSCWIICPFWELNYKKSLPGLSPTVLDLTNDLVSGDRLKHLALCKAVLITSSKKVVKEGITELYLDTCFWSDSFGERIHLMFPNLRRCALKQQKNTVVQHNGQIMKSSTTVRILRNICQLPKIEWLRIWGVDWTYGDVKPSSLIKNLRSSINPITDEEVEQMRNFLENCGLPNDCSNFIVEKDPLTNSWKGQILNELEPVELDDGFWDLMDKLDYEFFDLKNFFKDYQTLQNNFFMNLELP